MVATSTNDPYAILGVDRAATDAVIAAAHRRLARTFHPDVAGDDATADMMRINAAFDRIRDRKRRARHAVEEAEERGVTPSPAATATAAGTGRTHDGTRPGRRRAMGRAARASRRDARRVRCSSSGATSAGRSARSPASTRATWSGSRTSAKACRISRRSTAPCATSDTAGPTSTRRAAGDASASLIRR